MPDYGANGVSYYAAQTGSGTPLVLLHGFTGSSAGWQEHLPALAHHYRVITIDILGHGLTDSPENPARYRIEHVAADVTAVVAQILPAPAPPIHLLGYSMGGRLALYIAAHYPHLVRSLILESASPGLDSAAEQASRRRRDEALAGWIEENGIAAFVKRWEKLPLWASQQQVAPGKRKQLRAQRLQNNPRGLAQSLRGMGTGAQPSLWQQLQYMDLPVLLLVGALDEKFVNINSQMADLLLNPRLEIVAGAGHTIHWERPEAFHKSILDFLATDA